MAKVIIESAEVTRNLAGKGFWAEVAKQTRNGDILPEKWTVWTNEQVAVGDVVRIEGELTIKQEKWTKDTGEEVPYARGHVNNPQIRQLPKPEGLLSQMNAQEIQFDDEVPF